MGERTLQCYAGNLSLRVLPATLFPHAGAGVGPKMHSLTHVDAKAKTNAWTRCEAHDQTGLIIRSIVNYLTRGLKGKGELAQSEKAGPGGCQKDDHQVAVGGHEGPADLRR